jgi:glyoxylase-like metal-dependent hydrolase (beta-lactamase superfamily II)
MKYKFSSFTLHKLDGHIADLYIAEYKDKLLLLDCGCRSDHSLIVDYITRTINKPIEHLKLLVVTHFHPDHSGSAMSLAGKYKIPIAAPENINLWYNGLRGSIQHLVDTILAHIAARRRKMRLLSVSYPKHIHVDIPLNDNSSIPLFPDWQVISVPGHTSHDIVLFNRKDNFLYCSDTIVKIRESFLSPFPITDKIKMSGSLTRLSRLPVETIAMAHGGVVKTENFAALTADLTSELHTPLKGILKLFYPLTLFPEPIKKKISK